MRTGPRPIYTKCRDKGFRPRHVAEVGVWLPGEANVLDFLEEGVRTTLVEPDPRSANAIRERFGRCENVVFHAVAVADEAGELELLQRGASTFASNLPSSPALANDRYVPADEDRFVAPARRFDELDDGTIDLLSVDVEGSEWFVLKHMQSRPAVLSVELCGKRYTNPYRAEIERWLAEEGYVPWYLDHSDLVLVRRGTIRIDARDRWRLAAARLRLALRRLRYRFGR